jgi:hypothetical protein
VDEVRPLDAEALGDLRRAKQVFDVDGSRGTVLRLFPEGSPGCKATFSRCNHIESMNRHLKDLVFNDRVLNNGGDISPWFRQWRPLLKRRPLGARQD